MFDTLSCRSATESSIHVPFAGEAMPAGAISLCSSESGASTARPRRPCAALPKWRLKRVVDHIEAHLGEPITLGDLAAAAKLTRMHFAAQFRVATGLRPHEYLLRRRIDEARRLLLDESLSIVEIALTVGFQTQAHFTTVFGRFVGETPSRWRRAQAAERKPITTPRRGGARSEVLSSCSLS